MHKCKGWQQFLSSSCPAVLCQDLGTRVEPDLISVLKVLTVLLAGEINKTTNQIALSDNILPWQEKYIEIKHYVSRRTINSPRVVWSQRKKHEKWGDFWAGPWTRCLLFWRKEGWEKMIRSWTKNSCWVTMQGTWRGNGKSMKPEHRLWGWGGGQMGLTESQAE